jgi:hypothetical protein
MFNDTITIGTTPVTYTKRAPRGTRSVYVPAGDTPTNERRVELGHEVTTTKRVNSLVKRALVRPNPLTDVLEEGSIQIKIVRPGSFTDAEMQLMRDECVSFLTSTNFAKVLNQEQ